MAALRRHPATGVSIAFVARRWTDVDRFGAYVANALWSLADSGQRTLLVTPEEVGELQLPEDGMHGVGRVSVPDLNPRVRYFSELHRYADRIGPHTGRSSSGGSRQLSAGTRPRPCRGSRGAVARPPASASRT